MSDEKAGTSTRGPSLEYKRVLLKISGESLMGELGFGLHPPMVRHIAEEIRTVRSLGVELCLVVGGGNIYRGIEGSADGVARTTADYMGMLATVMNALALQGALESMGVFTRVASAIPMDEVCEPYIWRRAVRHLEKGRVCIFAAGTGNPYFTTDTAAALRASEMACDAILKGTQVDGVYDKDPKTHPDARRFDHVSYDEVLQKNLKVMDASAVALARDNGLPIVVFSLKESGGLAESFAEREDFPSSADPGRVKRRNRIEREFNRGLAVRTMSAPGGHRKGKPMADIDIDVDDLKRRMDGAVSVLRQEFAGLRTGRASTAILDPVTVPAYGSQLPVNQCATVNVPDPRMITVNVWDRSLVSAVDKAIRDSGLGLNPVVDGTILRLPIPELNEERRRELARVAGKYAEGARIAVRNVRRDGMDQIKAAKAEGMGEDDQRLWSDEIQVLTDEAIASIDEALKVKQEEIMQV